MHFLLCLLLGHFLGDFTLQTDYVFAAKNRGWPGVVLHAALVGGVTTLLILPYGMKAIIGVVIISFFHAIIDWIKISLTRSRPDLSTHLLFFLDQGIHVVSLVILAAILNFPNLDPNVLSLEGKGKILAGLLSLYLDPVTIGVILAYTISIFFGMIWVQMIAEEQGGGSLRGKWLTLGEKWEGVFERTLVTTGFWFFNGVLFLLSLGLAFGVYQFAWKKWMPKRFFLVRTAVSFLLAGIMGLILRFSLGS